MLNPSRIRFKSVVAVFATVTASLVGGCNLVLEPIEQRFLFRPWQADPTGLMRVASNANGIQEVRLKAPDGVTLHGWLKRPETVGVDGRFPLVIVFGGVRRETSWMIDRTGKPEHWGWLFMNYRGFGLSEGTPSERVLLDDTRLIYDYAIARPDVDARLNGRRRFTPA